MCDQLKEYLTSLAVRSAADAERFAALRRQNETFIEDIDGNMISSTTLVNSLYDGTIRTVNSMKYHSKSKYFVEITCDSVGNLTNKYKTTALSSAKSGC